VDGLGDQVLAGAALSLNKNGGGLAGSDLANKVQQLCHLARDADYIVISSTAVDLPAQRLHLGAEPGSFQRILYGDVQFVEVEGLADEIVGTQFERGLYVIKLWIGGDHDDGAGIPVLLKLVEHLQSAEVGHADIQQHEVRRFVLGDFQSWLAGFGLKHVVAPFFTLLAKRPANKALVINDQDLFGGHSVIAYYDRFTWVLTRSHGR